LWWRKETRPKKGNDEKCESFGGPTTAPGKQLEPQQIFRFHRNSGGGGWGGGGRKTMNSLKMRGLKYRVPHGGKRGKGMGEKKDNEGKAKEWGKKK